MKYRRLAIENFRPFHGSHTLEFSTDPARPVTMVFGANGGGKTTLLTAMYWCLFDSTKVDPNTPDANSAEDAKLLFNNTARSQIANGESGEMSVELELVRDDVKWRIKRTLKITKDAEGNELPKLSVELTEIDDANPIYHKTNQQFYINQLLDEQLGEFFFHAAETLAFPFDHSKGSRDRLRDCVYKIGGQGHLDSVVDQTRKATDVLRADRTKVADRQAQHSRIEDEIDRVNSEISKIDGKIVEKQNELDELEPVLTRNMAILQNVEAFAPFVNALQTARGLLTVAEEGLKIARRAQRGGTTDLWMVQALPMMEEFFGWFGPRAGEFPRIVNQNLILHMETTGRCICGHEIGPGELEAVRAMAEVGDDSASRRLTSLYDLSRDWGDKAKGARDTYEEVEAELAAAYEQGQIARAALTQAQTDLDNMGDQPLQDHHNLRQNVLDQTRAQGELRALIEANTKRKAELEHERQEFTRRNIANASEELKGAEATLLAAEMVKNLASTLKEIHAAACRPKLEKWMNENYWVDTENRVIRIDEDWNIRTYDKQPDGTLLPVPGGGAETTLLTYAFAAAASKLIPAFKGVGREAMPNDQQVREAETIPLVVDAPFSSLGDNYQKTVARLLPLATSQVVLFNEASHLNRFTDMGEAGRIGKLYSVKFTGDLVEVGPDGEPRNMTKTFDFGGEEITYLVKVPDVVGSSEIVAHTFAF